MLASYPSRPPRRSLARMCNLYSVRTSQAELRGLFDVAPERDRLGNLGPLPAIFPRGDAPVVRLSRGRWDRPPRRARAGGDALGLPHAAALQAHRRADPAAGRQQRARRQARRLALLAGVLRAPPLPRARHRVLARRRAAARRCTTGSAWPPRRPRPTRVRARPSPWRGCGGAGGATTGASCATSWPSPSSPRRPTRWWRPVHPERMVAILSPEGWEAWLDGPARRTRCGLIRPFPADADARGGPRRGAEGGWVECACRSRSPRPMHCDGRPPIREA